MVMSKVIVTDIAIFFVCDEFQLYCFKNRIFQKLIAPSHQATNVLAERNMQTLNVV